DAADSTAVVGTTEAVALTEAGRCLVSGPGPALLAGRIATTHPADIAAIASSATGSPRRPWLDPLPVGLSLAEARRLAPPTGRGIAFGAVDDPAGQRYLAAEWHPAEDGPLLVLGAARSGVTGA